jgi:NADP-dependent 3-hydroxy acid dehydrogenase YdfG
LVASRTFYWNNSRSRRQFFETSLITSAITTENNTSMASSLSGYVVIITGASSGIGANLAKYAVKEGAKVVLAARSLEKLNEIVESCGGSAHAIGVRCDVTKRDDHKALLSAAVEKFGKVDCWVNNAGVGMTKAAINLTDDDFDQMMLNNCKSVLYGMQTAVPYFKEKGKGHVINVSSLLGRMPMASVRSMYSASKAAMNSLTSNMRVDLQNEGFKDVQVSLFSPGVVATDFGLNAVGGGPDNRKMPGAQPVEEVSAALAHLMVTKEADVYSRDSYKGEMK